MNYSFKKTAALDKLFSCKKIFLGYLRKISSFFAKLQNIYRKIGHCCIVTRIYSFCCFMKSSDKFLNDKIKFLTRPYRRERWNLIKGDSETVRRKLYKVIAVSKSTCKTRVNAMINRVLKRLIHHAFWKAPADEQVGRNRNLSALIWPARTISITGNYAKHESGRARLKKKDHLSGDDRLSLSPLIILQRTSLWRHTPDAYSIFLGELLDT